MLKVRLFLAAYRVAQTSLCRPWLKTPLVGVSLGAFSTAEGYRLNDVWYSEPNPYHEEATNDRGLFANEARMVDRHCAAAGSVIVAGAGGGREMIDLHRRGKRVAGFECNAALVASGNAFLTRQNCQARIVHAPSDSCPTGDTTFGAAIIGWGVYIHMIGRDRRIAFLRRVRTRLHAPGVVLIGYCDRGDREPFFRRVHTIASPIRRWRHREQVELGDKLEPTLEHHFSADEVAAEAADAGLEVLEIDASLPGRALLAARDPQTPPAPSTPI